VIEKSLQPVFASTHIFVWLHLEKRNFLYSRLFSAFAPTSAAWWRPPSNSSLLFVSRRRKRIRCTIRRSTRASSPRNQPLLILPIFTRDSRGLVVVQFSREPEKVLLNDDRTTAFLLVNKFRAYGGFLFLSTPSLRASAEATHFGKASFVMARVLSLLMGSSAAAAQKFGVRTRHIPGFALRFTAQARHRHRPGSNEVRRPSEAAQSADQLLLRPGQTQLLRRCRRPQRGPSSRVLRISPP
jgi:hypothetical protein